MTGRTLVDLLQDSVRRNGARLAAEYEGETASYAELWHRAGKVAAAMREAGASRGERAAICVDVSPAATVAMWACMRAGLVACPVEVDPAVDWTRARITGCDPSVIVMSTDLEPEARNHVGDAPVVVTDTHGGLISFVPRAAAHTTNGGLTPDDPALILYTSGSTDRPKGAVHTHASVLAVVDWAATLLRAGPDDRVLANGPLHTDLAYAYTFIATISGATVAYVSPSDLAIPARFGQALSTEGITIVFATPSVLSGAVDARRLPRLRVVVFGGEPFAVPKLRALAAIAPAATFVNVYGSTESGMCAADVVNVEGLDDASVLPIGRAIAGATITIVDEDRRPARGGAVGELCVAGPTVMAGYWPHDTEPSARVRDRAPYRSGDLARVAEDGRIVLAGRAGDRCKRGGRVVWFADVERSLQLCPGIRDCAVVLVDTKDGERLVAFVRAYAASRAEIDEHMRVALPWYMQPDDIVAVDALPLNSMGKIDRRTLKARYGS
jgi:acyl-CoA synthetase (AMP-forming)/AMP-acid ligase II